MEDLPGGEGGDAVVDLEGDHRPREVEVLQIVGTRVLLDPVERRDLGLTVDSDQAIPDRQVRGSVRLDAQWALAPEGNRRDGPGVTVLAAQSCTDVISVAADVLGLWAGRSTDNPLNLSAHPCVAVLLLTGLCVPSSFLLDLHRIVDPVEHVVDVGHAESYVVTNRHELDGETWRDGLEVAVSHGWPSEGGGIRGIDGSGPVGWK